MWGALSDERTGLSFTTAAGPSQRCHSRVRSRWTRNHILLPQIRDFSFRRLLRLAGSRWRYSTPPPHGLNSFLSERPLIRVSMEVSVECSLTRKPLLYLSLSTGNHLHGNLFCTELFPRNRPTCNVVHFGRILPTFRNVAEILLHCTPSHSR
jgi:hypothetical protein